ncbi:EAL domain-containing protein [Gorillibacterium sp. sgz500922]|uniref:EAL domain-containing protein n=1 Tax=Gorillibacterium sp. sgz500922 TaxID=3446694 RepID=UPI003F670504
MDACRLCTNPGLVYEFKLDGARNADLLPALERFVKGLGLGEKRSETVVAIREEGVADYLDFGRDHLELENQTFRIDGGRWRPLAELDRVLGADWVEPILKAESIVSYCQPIVDAEERVVAHEVLSRFRRPDGSLAGPDEVFGAARERNRLYALDRLCRVAGVRSAARLPGSVFINFTPNSIYAPEHCLRTTLAAVREFGIDPGRLVFEVVESEQVRNVEHLNAILHYYGGHGFRNALDDAGEGASTRELLADIRPHVMKLAMRFVHGVAQDAAKQETALAFLAAAASVEAVPLAEGVEEEADFVWLRDRGYRLFQGYRFGRPRPVDGAEESPVAG